MVFTLSGKNSTTHCIINPHYCKKYFSFINPLTAKYGRIRLLTGALLSATRYFFGIMFANASWITFAQVFFNQPQS
jgi:hypothetical protein